MICFSRAVQGNPTLVTQQATTQVLVTDGGTLVIGGVIQTQNNVNIQQVPFLGNISLDPEVRKSGDSGKPVVLEGENSPHAKSIYEFARKVIERVGEIKANAPANVIQIQ